MRSISNNQPIDSITYCLSSGRIAINFPRKQDARIFDPDQSIHACAFLGFTVANTVRTVRGSGEAPMIVFSED
jgi:hypothetical protein